MVRGRERGMVLLFALGVLSLLAVMGMIFATFIRTEAIASQNRLDAVRAALVARSGIIRAVSELRNVCALRPYDSVDDSWVYKDKAGNLANGIPLEDENVRPTVEGSLGGTYTVGGNVYRVKVIDCASQINLNGKQPLEVMARMLDALGEAIASRGGKGTNPVSHLRYTDPSGKMRKGGEAIVYFRESLTDARFVSKYQLLELYQMSEPPSPDADKVAFEKFKLIEDFITAHSWVNNRSIIGDEKTSVRGFNTYRSEPHAPVNINLAPREVLFAVLKGLAGRFRYIYTIRKKQKIDADAPAGLVRPPGEEETEYDEVDVYVFVPPMTTDGANKIAAAIEKRRKDRPFVSFADWDYFVDTLSDAHFPDHSKAVIPYSKVDKSKVLADAQFQRMWKQAVRDILKANFNPNARPACYNTDIGARLLVDRANLFYPDDPAHPGDPGFPVPHYSTEWSFNSMGYFEVTSLGQIKDPKQKVVAKRKVRTIIRIGDAVTHTTQEEFEQTADANKADITTFPENMLYWKKKDPNFRGNPNIGFFTLSSVDQNWYEAGITLMDIPFEDGLDARNATWKTAEKPPTTFESDGMVYANENDILPDGLYTSILRRSQVRLLRYRAAAPNEASFSSESAAGVNIGAYRGSIEFWVKPDFDADAPVISGYLAVTHKIKRGPFTYKDESRSYVGGTQMFFFKNSDGSLRVSRFYYEIFYDASKRPVPDIPFGDPNPTGIEAYKYWPPYPDDRGMLTPPPGRPLPHNDDNVTSLNPHCKSARVDALVPIEKWGGWKAGEWHHIVITWNDESEESNMSNPQAGIRVAIDGNWLPGVVYRVPPGGASSIDYTPFSLINCINPVDSIYVASLYRWQRYRTEGLFKFEKDSNELKLSPNATIDNIFVTDTYSGNVGLNTSRFYLRGYYENTISIPFPVGADKLVIRGISYCAYAPHTCRAMDKSAKKLVDKDLIGRDPAGGTKAAKLILSAGRTPGVIVNVYTESGALVTPGARPPSGVLNLRYTVDIFALQPQGSAANIASPVFDSISIHYLFPKEKEILYERVLTE